MRIGNVELKNQLVLAPMAGVTDAVFRDICVSFGAALTFTEMVSAKSLMYNNKNAKELLYNHNSAVPCGVQLFGHEPEVIARQIASEELKGYPIIDINMGCPAPKIVNNGDGSALMRTPDLAYEIMRQAVAAADVPVTVKIRAGYDEDSINAPYMAYLAQKAGISAITIHGRTTKMGYSGRADLNIIKEVVNAVTIPVIGNGDITDGESALAMLEKTGCSAVMIARGAQGQPWIFEEALAALEGRPYTPPGLEDRLQVIRRHARELAALKGEAIAMKQFRKHLAWYTKGMKGAARLRNQITQISTLQEAEEILNLLS